MERYNIGSNKTKYGFDKRYEEISNELLKLGHIPSINDDKQLYCRIRAFFNYYSTRPEIERLKYIYAYGSVYPLPDNQKSRPNFFSDSYFPGCNTESDFSKWRTKAACDYIKYVYLKYHQLPAPATKPMIAFKRAKENWCYYQDAWTSPFKDLIYFLIENGCKDENVVETYNSYIFYSEEVQNRINQLLIEHGACTQEYIEAVAMPGLRLPENFIHHFYFVLSNKNKKYSGITPLGEICRAYAWTNPLYVHYRDLHKCDVNAIRERVIKQRRDWKANPPTSIEEWEQYGEYLFFIPKEHSQWDYPQYRNFDKPYPTKCIENGHPYFRYDWGGFKILDFQIFLIENNHNIKEVTDWWHYSISDLATDHQLTDNVDIAMAYRLAQISTETIVDDQGGVYLQEENGLRLIFLPPNAIEYKISDKAEVLSPNSLLPCKKTIQRLILGNSIKEFSILKYIKDCVKLEHIICPKEKFDEYAQLIYSKEYLKYFYDNDLISLVK